MTGGDLQAVPAFIVVIRLADGTSFATLVSEGIPCAVGTSTQRDRQSDARRLTSDWCVSRQSALETLNSAAVLKQLLEFAFDLLKVAPPSDLPRQLGIDLRNGILCKEVAWMSPRQSAYSVQIN